VKPETIKIDEVEYIRKDAVPATYVSRKEGPWEIGKSYFVRTVTMAIHGKLVDVTPQELVFVGAAWIADTGRFSNFVTGKSDANEVEPFPWDTPVIVGRGSIIDAVQRSGEFKVQK
jgi:hypothetical protein